MIACCLVAEGRCMLPGQSPAAWKTDAVFRRALASPLEYVDWPRGSHLRERLQWLAAGQRVAIFLDRRIDPGTVVELHARDISLARMLDQIALQCDASAVPVGSVVYVGPRTAVAGLSRVAEQRAHEASGLPPARARQLLTERQWQWSELAEPRQLVTDLAHELNLMVDGLDRIPHDLWPATELPPLRGTDRLTIVLTGFGLTFEISGLGDRISLVPMPTPAVLTRAYRTALPQMKWELLVNQFPEARIEPSAEGISLTGTQEDHERLQRILAQPTTAAPRRSSRAQTVHSLRVTQLPVDAILKALEQQLRVRLEYGPGIDDALRMRVSFDLVNVPLDELLRATLTPAGLTYRRDGDVLRIELVDER